jgi:uncharacterized membrane protein YvlD (DUF360 family)
MAVEQFNVQPILPDSIMTIGVVILVVGVFLVVANVLLYKHLKNRSIDDRQVVAISKYGLAVFGLILIFVGGFLCGVLVASSSPSVVTVGDGYINVDCQDFVSGGSMLGANSNKNVTTEEIAAAFVGEVGSGDFTLLKQYGLNAGDTNVGVFTLGNGATAYMASTNSTNLLIELKNGEYLIVGTSDTQALADSFAQNVHPLTPKQ